MNFRIDPVVGMRISHQFCVVTGLCLVEIGRQWFDATGANNHGRIILQGIETLVASHALFCNVKV